MFSYTSFWVTSFCHSTLDLVMTDLADSICELEHAFSSQSNNLEIFQLAHLPNYPELDAIKLYMMLNDPEHYEERS